VYNQYIMFCYMYSVQSVHHVLLHVQCTISTSCFVTCTVYSQYIVFKALRSVDLFKNNELTRSRPRYADLYEVLDKPHGQFDIE